MKQLKCSFPYKLTLLLLSVLGDFIAEGWMSISVINYMNPQQQQIIFSKSQLNTMSSSSSSSSSNTIAESRSKGKILVLGGNGYLGSNVVKRALLNDYSVTSLSRRGVKDDSDTNKLKESQIFDDRLGDARNITIVENILDEGGYIAVIHCIGVLFDSATGPLRTLNRFASGSGSKTDETSTYDDITRVTAFQAITATENYAKKQQLKIPFLFTSTAEANWPSVRGGSFVERNLTPRWLRRYIQAKRAVEDRLLQQSLSTSIRPIIFRPSLIYSIEKVPSLPAVGAFIIGNRVGLPFVDRPVTVQSLSLAMLNAMEDENISGPLGFRDIDKLCLR